MPDLLTIDACDRVASLYDEEEGFRRRVVMGQHGFGRGEYKYLAYPLPPTVQRLRTQLYVRLAPIANRWESRVGRATRVGLRQSSLLALPCRRHAGNRLRRPCIERHDDQDHRKGIQDGISHLSIRA